MHTQVAQKGDFMPGTENRAVSISGNMTSVQAAQNYVAQRISRETIKLGLEPFIISANVEYK